MTARDPARPALPHVTDAVASAVHGDACITCGDVAVVLEVASTDGHDATCVDAHGNTEAVATDLVEAAVGDRVLVHARVALDVVDRATPLGPVGPVASAGTPGVAP